MPDNSLGLSVVERIAPTDRLPFVKALAHLAAIDDEVTLDEKQAVLSLAKAWDMSEADIGEARDILRTGSTIDLNELMGEFSEANTPYLLLQELVRLSHADGSYADVEREETIAIATSFGFDEDTLSDIEDWVERGQVWDTDSVDGHSAEALEKVLNREDEDGDYSLDDISTADPDELDRLTGDDDED